MSEWGPGLGRQRDYYWNYVREKANAQLMYTKPPWFNQTVADIKRHEGFRKFAYPDPLSPLARRYPINKYWGNRLASDVLKELGETEALGRPWTYGYGFTQGVTPSHSIERIVADRQLELKVMEYSVMLDPLVPDWKKYPMVVQTVLVNLMFNMGQARLAKFVQTLNLIKAGKYEEAGRNLRKTLWFKQVGTRAVELTNRLINMRIEPEHQYRES